MAYLNLVNKKGTKAEILCYGIIGDGWWDDVSSDEIARELQEFGELDEINLRINSPGGSVYAGCAIYSTLKRHPAKVNVYIDGLCASIATVVAMAGDTINMSSVGSFMIHNPWTVMAGDSKELRDKAEILDKLKESIIEAYMTKVKVTKEELVTMMDKETTLTSSEALEKGFITNIEFKPTPMNLNYPIMNMYSQKHNIKNKDKEDKMPGQVEKMTMDKLKNENPELYNEIFNKGVMEERNRIKALDEMTVYATGETANKIILAAKYTEPKEANSIALELMKAMKETPKEDPKTDPNVKEKSVIEKMLEDAKEVNEAGGKEKATTEEKFNNDIDEIVNFANQL